MRTFWEKIKDWFTVSRVLVTVGNIIFFCYHVFWIGIDGYVSIIIQIIALLMEYLVSGIYEKLLLRSNRKINEWTRRIKRAKLIVQIPIKTIVFTGCFLLVYISIYYIRLQFFYQISWGITHAQVVEGIRNAIVFSPIFGIMMGSIVVWRKKRNLKKRNKGAHI